MSLLLKSVTDKYILIQRAYKGGVISLMFTYTQVNSLNETETHVSTATVVRFCKKLRCEGFIEFKYKLKDSILTTPTGLPVGVVSIMAYDKLIEKFLFEEIRKYKEKIIQLL